MSVAAFVFSVVRADTSLKWEYKCRIEILPQSEDVMYP